MKTIKQIAIASFMFSLCAVNAFGSNTEKQRPGGRHQGLPPAAYSACEGKTAGDEAHYINQQGERVPGTCEQQGNRLVFRPDPPKGDPNSRTIEDLFVSDDAIGSETLFVDSANSCGGNAPCYSSIQDAIDAAGAETFVEVGQGTYAEHIVFNSPVNLTLRGGWSDTFESRSSNSKVQSLTVRSGTIVVDRLVISKATGSFQVIDTGQDTCYNNSDPISCQVSGESFYGQDAQYSGNQPSYTNNGDGTVTDNVTGLMWQQSPDTDGDGDIDAADKLSYDEAVAGASAQTTGGYSDWRLPTIKELYSLILFSGVDPSGYAGTDTSGLIPFIDDAYFDFAYGDTSAGERIIDSQYASSNLYVSDESNGGRTLFGVNFADGRIKGYGLAMPGSEKTFFVMYVRGNTGYGLNSFADNGNGIITDNATGLMWGQNDSGAGFNWEEALAWVETQNAAGYLGYNDWRLPNAKELQSIVDYSRSPDTTGSAAVDPLFNVTGITNEAGEADYPFYWTGTTHANWSQDSGGFGAYVAFGRSLGYMNGAWVDVHGAGSQRSDPKAGDPADYPTGHGPQGDAIRIYNYVRLVRTAILQVAEATPALTYLFPATTYAGVSDQTLTLLGSNFVEGATVNFNGVSREATVVSPTHLTTEITAEELADAGTYSVSVTNPGVGGETSDSLDFTLLTVTFGETNIDVPDWTAATHEKLDTEEIVTNLDTVFDTSRVQHMDLTIDSANWNVMQSNLAGLKEQLGGSNDFSLMDDPIDVPCDLEYNGKQWYRVGIRFKGNSSLYHANSNKLPFKLNFDKFEDIYPAIKNQRFYGFKKFSLKNNFKDESEIHELTASELYRDFGLKNSHAALYKLYVDYGNGPVYFGLYTLVEEVDDTVLKTQYSDNDGNLYKPEENAATFAAGTFNTYEFAKKTNDSDLDYSDVQSLYDILNSDLRVTDPTAWKTDLEMILDVPVFLKWFAANNVLQNWDTYGVAPHNYYLYRNPDTQLFEWIPWDNNEALVSNPRCLSLNASEVTSRWPLLRYLLDDSDYAEQYRQNVHEFATNLFNATRMAPLYDTRAALIQDTVLSESADYTFTSPRRFSESISALKAHVAAREAAALAY